MADEALLVGELNPYGSAPEHALYPFPERSAGGRLCRLVLGLQPRDYLRRFGRVNLCTGRWSTPAARNRAGILAVVGQREGRPLVLLGSRVCAAFGVRFDPFTVVDPAHPTGSRFVILPHPSGLCRLWNEPDAYARARDAMGRAGVQLP